MVLAAMHLTRLSRALSNSTAPWLSHASNGLIRRKSIIGHNYTMMHVAAPRGFHALFRTMPHPTPSQLRSIRLATPHLPRLPIRDGNRLLDPIRQGVGRVLFSSSKKAPRASVKTPQSYTHPLDFPSYLVAFGLIGVGMTGLTEHMIRVPPSLVSVVRLEKPKVEFSHPYDKKPWWWQYWFMTKRLAYLTLLWIPCGTMAIVSYLTGDLNIRKRYLRLMVRTLEWAGCSFQKFGQWLSMRPDILTSDVIDVLSELRDNTDPHDMKHNREMFRLSFGCELEDIFEEFDPKPIASASVGQVHRARLRAKYAMEGGIVDVAVKVRHPRVLDETWIDTWMIFAFMDNSGGLLTIPFSQKDFTMMLQKQFDFEWEAYNMSKFAENFSAETGNSILRFPSVSGDLLSPSVLVESWGKGKSVDSLFTSVGADWKVVKTAAENMSKDMAKKKKQLAEVIFDMNMKMFLRDNFIHGDLHAGNLLYDNTTDTITVLDAGLISQIPPAISSNFVLFIQGMCAGDAEAITDQLLVFDNRNQVPGSVSSEVFAQRQDLLQTVQTACDRWIDPKTGQDPNGGPISVGDLMGEIMFGLNHHNMMMNGSIASTLLTISISEGLIRSLDPSFDMVTRSVPYLLQFSNSQLLKKVSTVVAEEKVGKEVVEGAKEAAGKVEEAVDVVIVATEEVKEVVGDKVEEVVDSIKRRTTGRTSLGESTSSDLVPKS